MIHPFHRSLIIFLQYIARLIPYPVTGVIDAHPSFTIIRDNAHISK